EGAGALRLRPRGEDRDSAAGRIEGLVGTDPDEITAAGGPDQENREDSPLMQKKDGQIAVELALPGRRVEQRTRFGVRPELVLAIYVGDAAITPHTGCGTESVGDATGPSGSVDYKICPDRAAR